MRGGPPMTGTGCLSRHTYIHLECVREVFPHAGTQISHCVEGHFPFASEYFQAYPYILGERERRELRVWD